MKKKLADKKTITREEFLQAINELEGRVGLESYSRVLDWKESMGFDRDEYQTFHIP